MRLKIIFCFSFIFILCQIFFVGIKNAEEINFPMIKAIHIENNEEQQLGKRLKFFAEAEGNNLKYQWSVYKENENIYTSEMIESNVFEYEFGEAGKYTIEVKAIDDQGNAANMVSEIIEIKELYELKIIDLSVDKQTPQLVGTPLTFIVLAEGKGLKYEWIVFKDYLELFRQELCEENIFIYTPTEPGDYSILVNVFDEYGNTIEKKIEGIKIYNPLMTVSLKSDKAGRLPLDTTFKFTVSAYGYDLKYLWKIFKDNKEVFSVLSDKNFISYTPKLIGNYKVQVSIEDGFGNIETLTSNQVNIYLNRAFKNSQEVVSIVNGINITSKTNNLILVDTFGNKVYVFSGKNGNWKLIKSMLCTDGKKSTPTVKGFFEINGRAPWLISHTPGVRAKYKVRFYKDYYFHSILVNPKGKIIDGRLGESLSHGCIRLSIENAKWLYDNIKDGTKVYIL